MFSITGHKEVCLGGKGTAQDLVVRMTPWNRGDGLLRRGDHSGDRQDAFDQELSLLLMQPELVNGHLLKFFQDEGTDKEIEAMVKGQFPQPVEPASGEGKERHVHIGVEDRPGTARCGTHAFLPFLSRTSSTICSASSSFLRPSCRARSENNAWACLNFLSSICRRRASRMNSLRVIPSSLASSTSSRRNSGRAENEMV